MKSVLIGASIGAVVAFTWSLSATTIAIECKKLGSFYVGQQVFECKLKEKNT